MSFPGSITRDDEMKFCVFIQKTILKINSDWTSGKIFSDKTIQQEWIKFTYSIEENNNQSGNRKLTIDFNGIIKRYVDFYHPDTPINNLILRLIDVRL